MSSLSELYAELRPMVVALADPLVDHSQKQLQARDYFLPHAPPCSIPKARSS